MTLFTIREIEENDLQNGFLETLNFLSKIGEISNEKILETLFKITKNPDYKIFVAVTDDEKIVGAIMLFLERKFIHECGIVGHIEDVVTHENFRRHGIASNLIRKAVKTAIDTECYKVILNCKENMVPFYEKFGFRKHEVEMRLQLKQEEVK